jgi:rhomboid protease GluP
MPKYEQSVPLQTIDNETALALSYQAMQQLQWNVLYAGIETLVGTTSKNWRSNSQQMICRVDNSELFIGSEMIKGEIADITGKNKRNTEAFINAFNEAKATTGTETIENNKVAINSLRESTLKVTEQQQQEAAELNQAMNLPGSNLYITYTIMAVNVLMFILMALNGAGIFEANGLVHIKWGSNYSPLTLSGDWWRLVSNIFIHFGIIHLAMNMYCLYTVGVYLEPMLGKTRYIIAYLSTGIIASVVSLWWHSEGVNSAGASGAIFGLYGLFLVMLASNLIPKKVRQPLLQSIGIFIVYNLVYGMKSGVDNSAHLGGLVSGAVFGCLYVYGIKKERHQQQKLQWIIPSIILVTVAVAFGCLQQNKVPTSQRAAVMSEIEATSYEDNNKFINRLGEFDKIHKEINEITSDTTLTDEGLLNKINETGLPELRQVEQIIRTTNNYSISPASHNKAAKLITYIGLRRNELLVLKQIIETKNADSLMPRLDEIRKEAYAVFDEVVKQ